MRGERWRGMGGLQTSAVKLPPRRSRLGKTRSATDRRLPARLVAQEKRPYCPCMAWCLGTVGTWRGRPADIDGFGQTILEDFRFFWQFRRCRNVPVFWRRPTIEEKNAQSKHEVIGRFGDEAYAVADMQGELWIVRERDFHGWPDPPRYAFFAVRGDQIWIAKDFDVWPRQWRKPIGSPER